MLKVQFASLMWDFDHGSLPNAFKGYFTKISDTHSYNTRASASNNLAKTIHTNTLHGSKLFKIIGVDIYNEINKMPFYQSSRSRSVFLRKYKSFLIDQY